MYKYLFLMCIFLVSCNQPPEIEQVGDIPIADSLADLVDPSTSEAPSFVVEQGASLTLPMRAVDPEGASLTWTAGPLPIGSWFDPQGGVLYFEPLHDRLYPTRMDVYVVVEDPAGAWDSVVVGLFVAPSPTPEP